MSTETWHDILTAKADAAFRQVAVKVLEVARQTGTPVIVWEEGRIVARSVEELEGQPSQDKDESKPTQALNQ
ncbi:MAG: hypothetical protein P4L84_27545 [Isosphaeraceae bacterium]|nr:hypothetical protein [Isosphaeraceae bacterium]